MPTVFVVMPYGGEFDTIYGNFIQPVFSKAGYDVIRASDIISQQNIIEDIVQQINRSDLVVADLTDCNPNVFYELGLAHAFRRPTILIAQQLEDVPFDLKPYRVVEYSRDISTMNAADHLLNAYAHRFLDGQIPFGSPVRDYLDRTSTESSTTYTASFRDDAVDDDGGFLDHVVTATDGFDRISRIVDKITASMEADVTRPAENATRKFQKIDVNAGTSGARGAQNIARRLAGKIATFNSKLSEANRDYAVVVEEVDDSLEFVVSYAVQLEETEVLELEDQIQHLRSLRETAVSARHSCNELVTIIESLPRIERRLNQALVAQVEQLRVYSNNLDRTVASLTRALNVWDNR